MDQFEPAIASFTAQGDLVNHKRLGQIGQMAACNICPTRDVFLRQTPRKGQMETELVHNIWIAPLRQKRVLARTQSSGTAAVQFSRAGGRAKRVEITHAGLRHAPYPRHITTWRQRKKTAQRGQFQTTADCGSHRRGKICRRALKFRERSPCCQPEWRLQRPMEPVLHRCHRDVTQTVHRWLNNVTTCHNIPTQPRGTKICQSAFRRDKVNRKSRI